MGFSGAREREEKRKKGDFSQHSVSLGRCTSDRIREWLGRPSQSVRHASEKPRTTLQWGLVGESSGNAKMDKRRKAVKILRSCLICSIDLSSQISSGEAPPNSNQCQAPTPKNSFRSLATL